MVRWNKAYIKGTKEVIGVDDELPIKIEYECIACGALMIRRRGEKRVHHFAHKEKTAKCNPESYFHKLGKKIFKETFDESSEFIIIPSSKKIDLKKEYGECLIEDIPENIKLEKNADLYIKHLQDTKKDIVVEILYTHQVSKKKIDKAFRIIEIRLPDKCYDDEATSDEIEQEIKYICTPPLRNSDFVRFYNFEEDVVYKEVQPTQGLFSGFTPKYSYNDGCLGSDAEIKSTPKFRNYASYRQGSEGGDGQTNIAFGSKEKLIIKDAPTPKREISISGYLVNSKKEDVTPKLHFEVSDSIKNKYPNIRHQPAVLPSCRQIIDVIVKDNDKEYWYGIDYHKYEVIKGDFERKIPNEWKEAVSEYILDLKPVKNKQ